MRQQAAVFSTFCVAMVFVTTSPFCVHGQPPTATEPAPLLLDSWTLYSEALYAENGAVETSNLTVTQVSVVPIDAFEVNLPTAAYGENLNGENWIWYSGTILDLTPWVRAAKATTVVLSCSIYPGGMCGANQNTVYASFLAGESQQQDVVLSVGDGRHHHHLHHHPHHHHTKHPSPSPPPPPTPPPPHGPWWPAPYLSDCNSNTSAQMCVNFTQSTTVATCHTYEGVWNVCKPQNVTLTAAQTRGDAPSLLSVSFQSGNGCNPWDSSYSSGSCTVSLL